MLNLRPRTIHWLFPRKDISGRNIFYIFNQIPLPYIDSHFSESNKTYFYLVPLQYNFVCFKKTIDMTYLEKDSFIKEIIFYL